MDVDFNAAWNLHTFCFASEFPECPLNLATWHDEEKKNAHLNERKNLNEGYNCWRRQKTIVFVFFFFKFALKWFCCLITVISSILTDVFITQFQKIILLISSDVFYVNKCFFKKYKMFTRLFHKHQTRNWRLWLF